MRTNHTPTAFRFRAALIRAALLLLSLWQPLTAYSSGPPNCEAHFLFTEALDGTFYAYSDGHNPQDSLSWSINGYPIPAPAQTATLHFEVPQGDTAWVCLSIFGPQGCTDSFCAPVTSGSDEDLCILSDCIYPGDANGDRKANIYDLPNIGLGYGLAGPPRTYLPDASHPTLWAPNAGPDWAHSNQGVNYKHFDCDGDGFIDDYDVAAIQENYAPDLNTTVATGGEGSPPVYLAFDEDHYLIDGGNEFVHVTAGIYAGSESYPAQDLHALALSFAYPYELTLPFSISVDYNEEAFLGTSEALLRTERDLLEFGESRYDIAWARKNIGGAAGQSRLATVNFIVSSDIIMGRFEPEIPFTTVITGLALIGAEGDTLSTNVITTDTTLLVDESFISQSGSRSLPSPAVQVYPNPAGDAVWLKAQGFSQGFTAIIADLQGRPVKAAYSTTPDFRLQIADLPEGIYILKAQNGDRQAISRMVIAR
ncbi:T9SS type A sorting domain-containing protein [Phaeodactylibacter luteus]|uniref:T9SS type A sorting domain-containing protein n=1 Tax=Phaeodactylibacter luteus TaxID=1564516 RepID=A0A5C6RJD2_9BACT|nr:T9SS type A sorting domain-containing protein [Phaeodactylibacter luteus]TXB62034.1 T9SS type A sorting domain-containing protein [Phaeodactylibacter luteus]